MSADRRWNHNIHYHPVVLGAVPEWARRALDVGCGDGPLARELRAVLPQVTGIDRDPASIDRARVQDDPAQPVDYLLATFWTTRSSRPRSTWLLRWPLCITCPPARRSSACGGCCAPAGGSS